MWTEAVSISASRYCDTLSRQQRSRRYFLCSRDDDVMLYTWRLGSQHTQIETTEYAGVSTMARMPWRSREIHEE